MWTQSRVMLLTVLWAEGCSASQIAARLNCGITRNAVIGKVHRLKLPARATRLPARRRPRVYRPQRERPARLPRPYVKPNRFAPSQHFKSQDRTAGMTKSQMAADLAAIWANTVAIQNRGSVA